MYQLNASKKEFFINFKNVIYFIIVIISSLLFSSTANAVTVCAPATYSSPVVSPDGYFAMLRGTMDGTENCTLGLNSSLTPTIRIVGNVGTGYQGVSINSYAYLPGNIHANLTNYTINGTPIANSTTNFPAAIGSTYVVKGDYTYLGNTYTVQATLAFSGATAAKNIVTFSNASTTLTLGSPTVTSITPASGPTAGGTAVTITGTNFTGATAVTIGGVAATGFTVASATSITVNTPAGTAGAKNIVVTTAGGTGTGTGLFTYAASATKANPTKDSTVRGQVAAQVTSVSNFVGAQTSNLSSHLSRLHSNAANISGYNDVSLNLHGEIQQFKGIADALVAEWATSKPYLVASNDANIPASTMQEIENEKSNRGVFGVWFEGKLNYGSINANTSNNKFTSSGLTTGMDYLLRDNLIVGAALGFGWDETKVDVQGTKTTSISPSISIYGSYKPTENAYIDGSLGYGFTSLKNKRWQSTDSVLVAGDRRANSLFGSLSIAGNYAIYAARIEPYVRGDFMYSKLNAYSETGNSTNLLSYNAMSFNSLSVSGGALVYYDINTSVGTFTPRLKGEYSSTNNSGGTQDIYYTNIASTVYSLGLDGIPTRVGSGQFALLYKNTRGVSGELGFEFSKGNASYISRAFNVQLNVPF